MINVLVIDDSKTMLQVMHGVLQELKVQKIDCFQFPRQAVDHVRLNLETYHLIFVDLNMPDMDGMEVIEQLSDMKFKGAVAIFSEMDDRVISLAADVTRKRRIHLLSCINKPITQNKIATVLNKCQLLFNNGNLNKRPMDIVDIRNSIRENRLIPYFQPKVDSQTGRLHGFETLARISIPGVVDAVLPDRFISVAEKHELIGKLTYQLIDNAFSQFNNLFEKLNTNCKIALNISPSMLDDRELPNALMSLILKHNISINDVIVEITEKGAIESTQQLESLNRLRIKGFGLSLDDYGTGFTNIHQLKTLPYTEIKIDRSLIHNIAKDSLSQVIVESLLHIAQELDIDVIAEGIEKREDFDYLIGMHEPLILQGHIISKPKPMQDACRWYKNWMKSVS